MAPPWVMFDSAASYNGTCANGAEPDIARLGVVLSFVIASIMTTTASILAMLLDQAFDSKGRFTLQAPVKYLRERFLDTEWKKDYAWRPFLDPLIIGLGDQQLITGYAVLLSGWIKVAQSTFQVQSAHFVLILYICALSSSSHLAALLTLRKYFRKYKLIARLRLTLVVFFAVFLLASMIAAICMPPTAIAHADGTTESRSRLSRLSFLVPLFLILVGFSTALVCILYDPSSGNGGKSLLLPHASSSLSSPQSSAGKSLARRRVADPKQQPSSPLGLRLIFYYLFLNPLIAFAVQILLAILSAILVLSQKFALPDDAGRFCGLQEEGEDAWGFGQTLSIVMLLLPAMSAGHTYLEGRQDIGKGFGRAKG
ncbi:Nn.00g113070.m01.CDS01 [Neocucurbitaria sp. VM-36]